MVPPSGGYFDWDTISAAVSDHSPPTTTASVPTTGQGSDEQVAPQLASRTDDPNSDSPRALASASFGAQSLRPLAPIQLCVVADIDEQVDSDPLGYTDSPASAPTTSAVDSTQQDNHTDNDHPPDPDVSTPTADFAERISRNASLTEAQREQMQAEREPESSAETSLATHLSPNIFRTTRYHHYSTNNRYTHGLPSELSLMTSRTMIIQQAHQSRQGLRPGPPRLTTSHT